MKANVIILAGGIGSRMKVDTPKQFIEVDHTPIIVDTIRNFERNERIDSITIVCLQSWIEYMKDLVEHYNLTKTKYIVVGGKTGHDSTRNGVFSLQGILTDEDFVVIHDAARPIVPQRIIDSMLDVAFTHGNACSAIECHDTVVVTADKKSGDSQIDRSSIMRVQTPQAYNYGLIRGLYERADADNLHNFVYANTMAIHYGTRIFFSQGFSSNVKITTPEDISFYKVLRDFSEEELVR